MALPLMPSFWREGETTAAGSAVGVQDVDLAVPDDELVSYSDEDFAQRFPVSRKDIRRMAVKQKGGWMAEYRDGTERNEPALDIKFEGGVTE